MKRNESGEPDWDAELEDMKRNNATRCAAHPCTNEVGIAGNKFCSVHGSQPIYSEAELADARREGYADGQKEARYKENWTVGCYVCGKQGLGKERTCVLLCDEHRDLHALLKTAERAGQLKEHLDFCTICMLATPENYCHRGKQLANAKA